MTRVRRRSAVVGGLALLAGALIAAGTVAMLMLLPLPPFSPLAYAAFKGVWCGILAALVMPPAIRLGLRAA